MEIWQDGVLAGLAAVGLTASKTASTASSAKSSSVVLAKRAPSASKPKFIGLETLKSRLVNALTS